MKKLLVRSLALLPLLLVVVGVNVAADPGNLFNTNERRIADAILQGKNVANFPNLDDRRMQKHILEGWTQAPEVLVVGSSRSMEIRNDFFPGRTFYNSWIGSARFPDYVTIYEAWRHRGMKPSLYVIGVDPWILNRRFTDQRWRSLQQDYNRFTEREGLAPDPDTFKLLRQARRFLHLVSPRYLQDSLQSILRHDGRPTATDATVGSTHMLLNDGSGKYPQAILDRSVEDVRAIARAYFQRPGWGSLEYFERLDEGTRSDFEKFIKAVRREGVNALLYLPPYHPVVYGDILASDQFKMVPAAEEYFRRFAQEEGVPIIGSYNPAAVNCGENDFRDGMHVADRAVRPQFLKYSASLRKQGD